MADGLELAELKQRAIAHGEALAERLAASIVLDVSWFGCVTESSLSIRKAVEPMTSDPALVEQLAKVCADAARARLHALMERAGAG